jgi:pSer/pThr/pTyr-binding forkhead associated (FHA) protein
MDTCYDCQYCFASTISDLPGLGGDLRKMARFRIELSGKYVYDTLLKKHEGATIKIGNRDNNTIVVPDSEVGDCQCVIFYSQEQLWAEQIESDRATYIGADRLKSPQSLITGDSLRVGTATITVLEA